MVFANPISSVSQSVSCSILAVIAVIVVIAIIVIKAVIARIAVRAGIAVVQRVTPCPKLGENAQSYSIASIRFQCTMAVPCSRGGRSEAQQNAPRQGAVPPITGVPDHS